MVISVQINVNTTFIAHVYIRNLADEGLFSVYEYTYYLPDKELIKGGVRHKREDGLEVLLKMVLEGVIKQNLLNSLEGRK